MSKGHLSADQVLSAAQVSAAQVLNRLQELNHSFEFDPKAVKARFLEIANLILEWLQSPRNECWWMDLLEPTIELEQCVRTLGLPDWLVASELVFQILEKFEGYEPASDGRRSLDPRWEPGQTFNPACFRIESVGTDGSDVSVKFSFCDPYRFMQFDERYQCHSGHSAFVFVTRSLQVSVDEIDGGKPIFDDIRQDAIFILKAWIRYVESRPEPIKSATNLISRFEAFRTSFECLKVLVEFLHGKPTQLVGGEFLSLSESCGHQRMQNEEAAYAAAWQGLAPQLRCDLMAPLLFGHETVGSFHELVAEISQYMLGSLQFKPFLGQHPWTLQQLIERCRDPQSLSRSLKRAERYRGWSPQFIMLMLNYEAGQMQLQQAAKRSVIDVDARPRDTRNATPRVSDDVTESTVADSVPCVYEILPKKFLRQELGKLRKSSPVDGKTLIPALKGLGVRLHPDFDISSAAFDLPVDVNSLGKFTSINDPKSRATLLEAWLQSSDNKKRRSKSKLGTKLGES